MRTATMLLGGFALLLVTPGCFSPPPEAVARLEATRAEGDAIVESFDVLEERFLGNQATVMHWRELARRHKEVSAVHCATANSHLAAMDAHDHKQVRKARGLKRERVPRPDSTVSEVSRVSPTQVSN